MKSIQVKIEDWDGAGAVGTTRCLVLSKSPQIPDRIDELVSTWDGSTPKPPKK
ncbi:hypothetical protein PtoMrB4_06970 [Metapseudomonas otitidis]|uniref:Uncharacterized protein n=1 Tax=Metapseudomonas otitidis TaxID=319939 RepID=A0A679GGS9_9GAMM|nr:hypothetical protein PtoMrB4_06970 [Pseudomonas otitidis]